MLHMLEGAGALRLLLTHILHISYVLHAFDFDMSDILFLRFQYLFIKFGIMGWVRTDFALLIALQKCQIHRFSDFSTFLGNLYYTGIILPLLLSFPGLNSYCPLLVGNARPSMAGCIGNAAAMPHRRGIPRRDQWQGQYNDMFPPENAKYKFRANFDFLFVSLFLSNLG